VKSVKQLDDDHLEWVAEIAGVRRQWMAKILEQVPDRKVAWAAREGATNAGAVTFEDVGGGQASVHLPLEYEPEGLLERVGDKLNILENQAEADLDRFRAFIEAQGYATGAWRDRSTKVLRSAHLGWLRPAAHAVTPAGLGCRARQWRPDCAAAAVAVGAAAAEAVVL
jgi:hypothetical protein